MDKEVTIIGGGLAGLTAAIHLSKIGVLVTVLEKNTYPKHKVCGEYISNEVLPYLKWLDLNVADLKSVPISELHFSIASGKSISAKLPLGGFGISRFSLDEYLYKKALENGCVFIHENVENVVFIKDEFTITTSNNSVLKSKIVIGAFGKRSNIDQKLNRTFFHKKSHWLAVKAHYSGIFDDKLVGLHNFNGGYCGVSKVENDTINICYLADYKSFQQYKNIDDYQKNVVFRNPILKDIFKNATLLFDKPLTISQISFEEKKAVENHILMIGDTAGLIHPLCGNGMAMAIHSAKIVSELIQEFYSHAMPSRIKLENDYARKWNLNFKKRLQTGRFLSNVLQKPALSNFLMKLLIIFPVFLPIVIKKTHGKPIIFNSNI